MQYIRSYHAAYKYTIQLAHARPTMHRIRLVRVNYQYLNTSDNWTPDLDGGDPATKKKSRLHYD